MRISARKGMSRKPKQRATFLPSRTMRSTRQCSKLPQSLVETLRARREAPQRRRVQPRGDALQIILIQVKGGTAARPTPADATRLRAVAKRHGACDFLLATWKKGMEARFFRLRRATAIEPWTEITGPRFGVSMTSCSLHAISRSGQGCG